MSSQTEYIDIDRPLARNSISDRFDRTKFKAVISSRVLRPMLDTGTPDCAEGVDRNSVWGQQTGLCIHELTAVEIVHTVADTPRPIRYERYCFPKGWPDGRIDWRAGYR